jgi:hypothetical protein
LANAHTSRWVVPRYFYVSLPNDRNFKIKGTADEYTP